MCDILSSQSGPLHPHFLCLIFPLVAHWFIHRDVSGGFQAECQGHAGEEEGCRLHGVHDQHRCIVVPAGPLHRPTLSLQPRLHYHLPWLALAQIFPDHQPCPRTPAQPPGEGPYGVGFLILSIRETCPSHEAVGPLGARGRDQCQNLVQGSPDGEEVNTVWTGE